MIIINCLAEIESNKLNVTIYFTNPGLIRVACEPEAEQIALFYDMTTFGPQKY